MNKKTKEFISQNPFTSIFFILGMALGLLLASQIKLPEKLYGSMLNNQEALFGEGFQDPTGGLISNFLIVLPISLIVFALTGLIGGVFFAIFGYFIDKENRKFKEGEKNLFDKINKESQERKNERPLYKTSSKMPMYDPYLGRPVYPR
ncbi:hypothetical protein GYA25_01575 [Candidatus Woesearchaeota archaeon]|jgi:predicted membrane protein|nr:hypothetical protein [Candidatus Woesearchaeota archaeon]